MIAGQPTQPTQPTLGTHPGPPKGREHSYSATEHQPPLVLPRRITHPNLPKGKEQITPTIDISPLSFSPVGEMQVTPLLS